ncbi:MAG: hypothetical protein F6K63_29925 [Moorea sp. SIO1G6]|uniref:hypothetical protein n=1 Tax=Moorena sp. SIO1G6 TaxID=2607840 RepID=UPI0013C1DA00|nr:hypothetical protein [Moorena sp. SIO1G6]NET68389.1 hypothetical protein [Moorena sp. SIO1G6]
MYITYTGNGYPYVDLKDLQYSYQIDDLVYCDRYEAIGTITKIFLKPGDRTGIIYASVNWQWGTFPPTIKITELEPLLDASQVSSEHPVDTWDASQFNYIAPPFAHGYIDIYNPPLTNEVDSTSSSRIRRPPYPIYTWATRLKNKWKVKKKRIPKNKLALVQQALFLNQSDNFIVNTVLDGGLKAPHLSEIIIDIGILKVKSKLRC